jgi:hypothetical protein
MRVLILQNCEYETLGTYERYLMQNYLALIDRGAKPCV